MRCPLTTTLIGGNSLGVLATIKSDGRPQLSNVTYHYDSAAGRARVEALLGGQQRAAVLDDIAFPRKAKAEHQAGVTFFNRFRDAIGGAFFSSQLGWQDLRYMGNVFNPNWNGCPPAALEKLGVAKVFTPGATTGEITGWVAEHFAQDAQA